MHAGAGQPLYLVGVQYTMSDRIVMGPAGRDMLESAGIQPTRQRCLMAQLLLERPVHMTAEDVLERMRQSHDPISRATVYNTLELFVRHGLLKELQVEGSATVYDSNTEPHHHLFHEDSGKVSDLPHSMSLSVLGLDALNDVEVCGVEVMVRVRPKAKKGLQPA